MTIGDIFLYALASIFSGIASVLPTQNIPTDWVDAMSFIFTTFTEWNGFLPLSSLVSAAATVIVFEMAIFALRVAGVGIALVRGVKVLR